LPDKHRVKQVVSFAHKTQGQGLEVVSANSLVGGGLGGRWRGVVVGIALAAQTPNS
jgi:hypothetical protein